MRFWSNYIAYVWDIGDGGCLNGSRLLNTGGVHFIGLCYIYSTSPRLD